ncbi:hypothetical protein [Bradyrhizobium sp. JYMT SZCCT0428]|uniref:hypothetical protein n=1 Tax=Bradyrhizobium sp. JYMT SZCCT0428 TaxID=2807673 RepID=UPI001BA96816|nr:hypothetical protein [Bradyrhizobium sp. JYMT SZCCT0428]MBR1154876.1 hypothetical protein [Bradyrhizobium sp. JYMT SZCCT0428]
MNRPLLRDQDFDAYASISENVSVRRNIVKVSYSRSMNVLHERRHEPTQNDSPFDAKQNLRTTRAAVSERQVHSPEMMAMAEEALARQGKLTPTERNTQIEILASDLSKIFD